MADFPTLPIDRGRAELMDAVACLPTLDELRGHVLRVLCGHDQLDPEQTPLREYPIQRKGRPCGLFFHVHGPRQVRSHAIWAGDEGRLLFYDSSGVRFAQTHLSEGPDPAKLATNSPHGTERKTKRAA